MKGYWIATYKQIDNLEKLKEYAEKATPIIKEFGGKPIIRGGKYHICLLYTSPSPRDREKSRMPSSA